VCLRHVAGALRGGRLNDLSTEDVLTHLLMVMVVVEVRLLTYTYVVLETRRSWSLAVWLESPSNSTSKVPRQG
jgi:hypothetical protein